MITNNDGIYCGHFLIPYITYLEDKVENAEHKTDKEYYQHELTDHREHLRRFMRRRSENKGFQNY